MNVKIAKDQKQSHIHLHNLRGRDPFGIEPLGFALDGHEKVVKIHDHVHAIVHGGVPTGIDAAFESVTVVGKGKGCGVMEPVQKDDGSLVDNQKEGVDKLAVGVCVLFFWNIYIYIYNSVRRVLLEHNNQNNDNNPNNPNKAAHVQWLGDQPELPPHSGSTTANGGFRIIASILQPRIHKAQMQQMKGHAHKAKGRKDGQEQIPNRHGASQVPRLALRKVQLTIINHGKVSRNGHHGEPLVIFHPPIHVLEVVLELPASRSKKRKKRWVRNCQFRQ